MLRKLLKYEFRASLLILPICLVAMALLYGAGWAAKAIGISQPCSWPWWAAPPSWWL